MSNKVEKDTDDGVGQTVRISRPELMESDNERKVCMAAYDGLQEAKRRNAEEFWRDYS